MSNILFTAEQAAEYCGGKITGGNADITSVVIDSRDARGGSLFVGLKGENRDGNDFIDQAAQNGASCVLTTREPKHSPGIVVQDTLFALQQISKKYKEGIDPFVVAVTGSVGKTTTKEFIACVLEKQAKTQKTNGNYNSVIGLPLTLLQLERDTANIVLEMGMSYAGEIKTMSEIVCPDIAVITNIGTSHMENLGSRENILKAKLEITSGLKAGGTLILNGDDVLLYGEKKFLERKYRVKYAALYNEDADYIAKNITFSNGALRFDLYDREQDCLISDINAPVIGMHNVYNAMISYICGNLCGMGESTIKDGLMNFHNTGNRQRIYKKNGVTVIADCYNAAPESMRASISVLATLAGELQGKSFAVLGDMKELGEKSAELHREVGKTVCDCGIMKLFTYGEAAQDIAKGAADAGMPLSCIQSFPDLQDAGTIAKELARQTKKNDAVLFKASRAVMLERVIDHFEKYKENEMENDL